MPATLDFSAHGELVEPLDFSQGGELVADGPPKLPLADFLANLSPQDRARQADLARMESESPAQAFGKAMGKAGRGLYNVAQAYGFEAVGDPEDQAKQLGVSDPALKKAGLLTEPSPSEGGRPSDQGIAALPGAGKVLAKGARGLVETAPQLAAVAGAQAMGVPAPLAAAAVFGSTEEGFSPEQAAVAAALPFVGKYSGRIIGALAKKLGVSEERALQLWKGAGAMAGAAGYLATIDESKIQNLPPEQRDQARIDMVAGLIGQSVLGPMGVEKEPARAGTANVEPAKAGTPRPETTPTQEKSLAESPKAPEAIQPPVAAAVAEPEPQPQAASAPEPESVSEPASPAGEPPPAPGAPGDVLLNIQKLAQLPVEEFAPNKMAAGWARMFGEDAATPEHLEGLRQAKDQAAAAAKAETDPAAKLAAKQKQQFFTEAIRAAAPRVAAKETGFALDPVARHGGNWAETEPDLPDEIRELPKLLKFERPSEVKGVAMGDTVYVPEGSSYEEIVDALQKKAAEFLKGDTHEATFEPVAQFDPAQVPTQEIPVAGITLSKDAPNFKIGADPETGVVPGHELGGKYQRLGTGPIIVWRRNNGALEVITGRHRLELARRSGEKTIPAQVVDEAGGFTREMALTADAEANIREGQGTTEDYAHYFKHTATEEAARSRGLLGNAKGRAGWDLGKNASDDLQAAWQAGKTTEAQALEIARAAPGNAAAQQIGLKFALQGKPPEFLANVVKAAMSESGGRERALDLFGRDDSAMRAMEEQAKRAGKLQADIRAQIAAASGAAKNPEAARKLGVDVNDPASVKARVQSLRGELARWENWPLHPDLVAKVKGASAPASEKPATETPAPVAPAPKLGSGQKQGDLIASTQREDLSLAGEQGTDAEGLAAEKARSEKTAAEAKASAEKQQQPLAGMEKAPPKTDEQMHAAISDAFSKAFENLRKEGWKFDPNFGPLELVLKPESLDQFMFMGSHPHPTKPGRMLYEYKNGITRRYLRLDDEGQAYGYNGGAKTAAAKYPPLPLDEAIDRSFEGVESMGETRESKYNENFIRKRNEALLRAGFGVARATPEGTLMSVPKAKPGGQPIPPGPGAATYPGARIATDIGAMESNIPPLEKLAQAVRAFPRQPGSFAEKFKQWLDDTGVVKDQALRALAGLRAVPAWIKAKATTLPDVGDLDRRVAEWNKQDWIGGQAARTFKRDIARTFPNRAKVRALSNWINAGGDRDLLSRQAQLTKDPALRKTYDDALKFGPREETLARAIRQYHDEMLAWAQREGALEEGLDNYLHRYYREGDPSLERKRQAMEYLRFTKDFAGFKKRYYDSDFEAEQAGKVPEKDAAKRILAYDYGFRRALIAREFVRASFDSAKAVAKDGRPELDVAGSGEKVGGGGVEGRGVTLIKPKSRGDTGDPKDYRGDYARFNHPAFQKWKFATEDFDGKPILVQGDVLVHPELADKYRALFESSWWGKTPLRRFARGLSSFTKQTMLQGPFHLFQITTGGIEHRINPFRLEDLNTSDPKQQRMAEAGLYAEEGPYMTEGVSGGGLLDRLPVAGEYFQKAKEWLFQDYIPRWKMTLALAIEGRATERYAADLRAGKITPEQITRLAARQSAAVFGGQNMRAQFRSKTFQDNLRMLFLAPDFGEERLRQAAQALGKYGHEQRAALVTGALGLMVVAKLVEKALTGQMNLSRPFTVTYNGKEYGMRNPASDLWHLVTDPIGYVRNRLNPVYTRPMLELITGRDAFGRKRSAGQQLKDEAKQIVPIPARGLVEKEQTFWESLLNSTGITEHRRSAFGDVMKKIAAWKDQKGYTAPGEFVYDPDKDPYHPLTSALASGSDRAAAGQLRQLLAGKGAAEGRKVYQHYRKSLAERHFLTGSKAHDAEFLRESGPADKALYLEAKADRLKMWNRFLRAWESTRQTPDNKQGQ